MPRLIFCLGFYLPVARRFTATSFFAVVVALAAFGASFATLAAGAFAAALFAVAFSSVATSVAASAATVFGVAFFVYAREERRVELVDAAKVPFKHIADWSVSDALERT